MAILVDENTKVLVQGITGRDGSFHTRLMLDYGTKVVAGVTPGKGGQEVHGVRVYNTVKEAVEETGANTSIIFVPPKFAVDAIFEAAEAGIKLIVTITEGIPALEESKVFDFLKKVGARMIGPNCPGIISPGKCKVGILPAHIFKEGEIGVVSRSGTLTYEIVYNITKSGFGQSTCIGIGGDAIHRDQLHRCSLTVRKGPANPWCCSHRRNRRDGRTGSSRIHKRPHDKTRCSLHRGTYCSPGEKNGTCRCYNIWLRGHS